ncbi:DNA excision repair protein ERCC-8-like isoform X3 [Convolutriloba macropyga]|uniref:DNA excision repair protein ERCC-8-like isoform X3 n=1 Tax=Convolutriloba macropyga TaxID=536237 RepID=UPI003F5244BB
MAFSPLVATMQCLMSGMRMSWRLCVNIHLHHVELSMGMRQTQVALGSSQLQQKGDFSVRSGIVLFDIRSGSSFNKIVHRNRKKERNAVVMDVHWSPANDRHLLSCSPDDGLKLYDVRKGSVLMSYELSQLGQSDKSGPSSKKRDLLSQGHYAEQTLKSTLDFSPISSLFTSDGDSVVSLCSSGRLLHFNTASGTLIHNTTLRSKTVPSLLVYQFSTSRAHRADSVFIPNGSNILHRYNSKTGVVDQMTSAHFTGINCCELNDSQLKLLSSGKDREIVTWMATRKEKLVLDESEDLSDWDS